MPRKSVGMLRKGMEGQILVWRALGGRGGPEMSLEGLRLMWRALGGCGGPEMGVEGLTISGSVDPPHTPKALYTFTSQILHTQPKPLSPISGTPCPSLASTLFFGPLAYTHSKPSTPAPSSPHPSKTLIPIPNLTYHPMPSMPSTLISGPPHPSKAL